MAIYRWLCPICRSAYILPRHRKHRQNHWRCYSCGKVFSQPFEAGTMSWGDHFEAPLEAAKPQDWAGIVERYSGPYKFPSDMMLYNERPLRTKPDTRPRRKRNRATLLVTKDGKLLLVRERGARHWSLPGGGMEKGEPPLTAACRELDEETGLRVLESVFLFDYETPSQHHHVCLLTADGTVELQLKELGDFRWWDGQAQLSIIPSATEIIDQAWVEGHLGFLERDSSEVI